MQRINVHEILNTPLQAIFEIPDVPYEVEYDDGKVLKSHKEAIAFDRYTYEMLKGVPNVTIGSDLSCISVMDGKLLNAKTHITSLERVYQSKVGHLNLRTYEEKEPVLLHVDHIHDMIFNDIIGGDSATESMTGIDATDFLEIMEYPEIQEIHSQIEMTPDGIERTHRSLSQFVKTCNYDNPLIKANQSQAANNSQFNQCLGPRGYVSDLDRTVFGTPIIAGFIEGLHSLYDIMIESRTAAKALNAAGASIQKSEYASRRFQILTMVVRSPNVVDCGSTDLKELIMSKKYLPNFKGKWYKENLDEVEFKCIKGDEEHLIGKTIHYRHVKGCQHPNRQEICTTCLGNLSNNLKPNTNLGAVCSMGFMKDVTQKILSTKHEVKSVSGSSLILEGIASNYFVPNEDNELMIRPEVNTDGLNLVLDSSKLDKLTDVLNLSSSKVPMGKIGELKAVGFLSDDLKIGDIATISNDDRMANITRNLLDYIKTNGYDVDSKSNYVVSLKNWKKEDPMFTIPLKEADVSQFIKILEKIIEGTERKKLTYDERLERLFDIVFERTSCNVMVLEVLAYATSTYNVDRDNYRLARGSVEYNHSDKSKIFRHRSKSQLLTFEKQLSYMLKEPNITFKQTEIESHPFDSYFMPQEVIFGNT